MRCQAAFPLPVLSKQGLEVRLNAVSITGQELLHHPRLHLLANPFRQLPPYLKLQLAWINEIRAKLFLLAVVSWVVPARGLVLILLRFGRLSLSFSITLLTLSFLLLGLRILLPRALLIGILLCVFDLLNQIIQALDDVS